MGKTKNHSTFVAGVIALCIVCAATFAHTAQQDQQDSDEKQPSELRDDFEKELKLDWNIVRPNEANVSLHEYAGELTIFTERGSIFQDQDQDKNAPGGRAKNLHLIENPCGQDEAWQITTCLNEFEPSAQWHQAGLLIYDDDENYIKCVLQWNGRGGALLRFAAEKDQAYARSSEQLTPEQDKVWLRITKRGETYIAFTSYDGKEFDEYARITWDGAAEKIGLMAKNGGSIEAPTVEARFEFFEFEELDKND